MCGRFAQAADPKKLYSRFKLKDADFPIQPRYNIAPNQHVPVIINKSDDLELKLMRWGLVPSWSKDQSIGARMINARAETISEKPSFRTPLKRKRCLVPASGFYEWKKEEGRKSKTPIWIGRKDHELFAFAGLWDRWTAEDKEALWTFTIITTEANKLLRTIHDRMPVILNNKTEMLWLDSRITEANKLTELLIPYPSDFMEAYEVSTLVNKPENDLPECVKPIKQKPDIRNQKPEIQGQKYLF